MVDPRIGALHYEIGAKMGGLQAGLTQSLGMVTRFGAAAAAAYGAVQVAQATVDWGTDAYKQAAAWEDAVSKNKAIFGDYAKTIERETDRIHDQFGLSKSTFSEAAASFGSVFKQLGTGQKDAAKLGVEIAKLATDMRSLYGGPMDQAVTAINAAFRGQMDPLERYMIFLNAAQIEQEALLLGYSKVGSELTRQAKAHATLSLIIKGTTDAKGDLARTSNSAANQIEEFNGRMEELKTTVGTALAAFVTPALSSFNDGLGEGIKKLKTITPYIQEAGAVTAYALRDISHYASQMGDTLTFGGLAFQDMIDKFMGGDGKEAEMKALADRITGREVGKTLRDAFLPMVKPIKIGGTDDAVLKPNEPNRIVGTLKLDITRGASELSRKIQEAIFDDGGIQARQLAITKDIAKSAKVQEGLMRKMVDKPNGGAIAQ